MRAKRWRRLLRYYGFETILRNFSWLNFHNFITAFKNTVAPKIVPFSRRTSSLQKGERITLTCTIAKGDSPINILWQKDQENIQSSEKGDIKVIAFDEFNSMLTIEDLDVRHIGNYSCLASNSAGTAIHYQTVHVNGTIMVIWMSYINIIITFCFVLSSFPWNNIHNEIYSSFKLICTSSLNTIFMLKSSACIRTVQFW